MNVTPKCHTQAFREQLTEYDGDPLISTLSANLTLEGLFFSRCFLAALSRADFRSDCWGKLRVTKSRDNVSFTKIYYKNLR